MALCSPSLPVFHFNLINPLKRLEQIDELAALQVSFRGSDSSCSLKEQTDYQSGTGAAVIHYLLVEVRASGQTDFSTKPRPPRPVLLISPEMKPLRSGGDLWQRPLHFLQEIRAPASSAGSAGVVRCHRLTSSCCRPALFTHTHTPVLPASRADWPALSSQVTSLGSALFHTSCEPRREALRCVPGDAV